MKQPESHSEAQRKRELRTLMRARRLQISSADRAEASARAASFASSLQLWAPGARIAAYMASNGEIDPAPLLHSAAGDGLQLCLPVINQDRSLNFRYWRPGQPLVINRFGIAEPAHSAPECPLAQIDIMILPLVAWDRRGGRLGMGGGYYDRTLAGSARALLDHARDVTDGAPERAPKQGPRCLCGLGYSWQEVEQMPQEPWDVRLDTVLTEQGLLQLGNKTTAPGPHDRSV